MGETSMRLLLVAAVITGLGAASRPSAITLENNEYNNILVSISPEVPESPTLIQTIQDTFKKASAILYTATNQRAVFRGVTILVPNTWSENPNYQRATTQVFSNSDIVFTQPPSPAPPPSDAGLSGLSGLAGPTVPAASSAPHSPTVRRRADVASTRAFAGCGLPGIRVTMTTDLLTNARLRSTYGSPDKLLVHEWAHFRWGVFNEYPDAEDQNFYFSPSTGKLEGIRCSLTINGVIRNTTAVGTKDMYCLNTDSVTGLYPPECVYLPYPSGPSQKTARASIMDRVSVAVLTNFCDDDQSNNATAHNYEAPSRHNLLCAHRSTWAIISESQDFSHGANLPRTITDTAPVFTVVQAPRTRRMVVAIDTSPSMAAEQKLNRTQQAATTVGQENTAPDVEFTVTTLGGINGRPRAESVLNATTTPDDFLSHDAPDKRVQVDSVITTAVQLPTDMKSTARAGVLPAVTSVAQVLHDSTPVRRLRPRASGTSLCQPGDHLVIVTEGHRVADVDLTTVVPRLQEAGIIVSFVLLGGPPPQGLLALAHQTGGRVFYDSSHHESTGVTDAFLHLFNFIKSDPKGAPIQVYSRSLKLTQTGSAVGQVAIDQTVGPRTKFVLFYSGSHQARLEVRPPSHLPRLSEAAFNYSLDESLRVVRCEVPVAESGVWTYSVTSPDEAQRASLLVLTSRAHADGDSVRLTGHLLLRQHSDRPAILHVFAEATHGDEPVTGLTVEATVFTPEGDPVKIVLLDNGAGADIEEGDGVYSRYFLELTVPGVYSVYLTAFGSWIQGESSEGPDNRYKYVTRAAVAGSEVVHPKTTFRNGRDTDLLPPARITNLRIVRTSSEENVAVLTWIAPGGDLDKNRAFRYFILIESGVQELMSHSANVQALTQEDMVHGNLSSPSAFGERECMAVRIPSPFNHSTGFALTIFAVDEIGNEGDHSNYVTGSLDNGELVTDTKLWQDCQKVFQQTDVEHIRHRRANQKADSHATSAGNGKKMATGKNKPKPSNSKQLKNSESKADSFAVALLQTVNIGIGFLIAAAVLALFVGPLSRYNTRKMLIQGREQANAGGNLYQIMIDR